MKDNIIVRADHYPNWRVIPISITIDNITFFVISIVETSKIGYNGIIRYSCKTNNGNIVLNYCKGNWELES